MGAKWISFYGRELGAPYNHELIAVPCERIIGIAQHGDYCVVQLRAAMSDTTPIRMETQTSFAAMLALVS